MGRKKKSNSSLDTGDINSIKLIVQIAILEIIENMELRNKIKTLIKYRNQRDIEWVRSELNEIVNELCDDEVIKEFQSEEEDNGIEFTVDEDWDDPYEDDEDEEEDF